MIFERAINSLTDLSGISIDVMQSLFMGVSVALAIGLTVIVIKVFRKPKRKKYR